MTLSNCAVGEDSWESLGLQGNPISQSQRKSVLNIHWKDWCWSSKSNTLATWCEELTHWKRPWCWEKLKAGGGDDRGWDGWMASLTQGTWIWLNSGSWWWTGKPGMLQSMESQKVGNNWAIELNQIRYSFSEGELVWIVYPPVLEMGFLFLKDILPRQFSFLLFSSELWSYCHCLLYWIRLELNNLSVTLAMDLIFLPRYPA